MVKTAKSTKARKLVIVRMPIAKFIFLKVSLTFVGAVSVTCRSDGTFKQLFRS